MCGVLRVVYCMCRVCVVRCSCLLWCVVNGVLRVVCCMFRDCVLCFVPFWFSCVLCGGLRVVYGLCCSGLRCCRVFLCCLCCDCVMCFAYVWFLDGCGCHEWCFFCCCSLSVLYCVLCVVCVGLVF